MAVSEYIGAVKLFAGNYAISTYAFCQGQLMSITQNQALFSLLGTTYGGNGTSTFALPDLRSRLPIGQGQGRGLSSYVVGEYAGVENVTLLTSNVPPHTHTLNATLAQGTVNAPGPGLLAGNLASTDGAFYAHSNQTGFTPDVMAQGVLPPAGNNLPHNNIQPCMGINYIIALQGIYPSRS
jgi:microcystin-dependent protein